MPKKQPAKKKLSKEQKAFKFYDSARGHLILALIIWFIGFNILILAIDSGSMLQWGAVVVSLIWGGHHLTQSIKIFLQQSWNTNKKN
mgnify:CR=1 FL=1